VMLIVVYTIGGIYYMNWCTYLNLERFNFSRNLIILLDTVCWGEGVEFCETRKGKRDLRLI